tara:strand:+ start:175 stop:1029 length:855 start_codon:yes stop_codon:yes gene_type:complete
MNDALRNYMLMKKMPNKELIQKTAENMTDQQQKELLANLQFGDFETRQEIAPYMPEGSNIDISKANLVPLFLKHREKGFDVKGISLKGSNNPYRMEVPGGGEIEAPGNKVSALGAVNANPRIWAHEFRHFEDLAGSDSYGYNSEHTNRVLDLFAARSPSDFQKSINMLASAALEEGEALKNDELKGDAIDAYNLSLGDEDDNLDEALDEILKMPFIQKSIKSIDYLEGRMKKKYPKNLQYKNFLKRKDKVLKEKKRKQEIKDEGYEGLGFLPVDFKAGGRVKIL